MDPDILGMTFLKHHIDFIYETDGTRKGSWVEEMDDEDIWKYS